MEEFSAAGFIDVAHSPTHSVISRETIGTRVLTNVILDGEIVQFETELRTVAELKALDETRNAEAQEVRGQSA